ncbi:MAG: preprotein translocase subunit YajC [Clostridia bacterium]|nr:preprotein translocase subunit YajC [Clostridia bacterium]
MLWNLLSDANSTANGGNSSSWIVMLVLLAVIVVFMILSRRTQKKRQDEMMSKLDAIQPGNKVKTIGGICGVVVEICPEDNTFVLETGTEKSGKSYIKFDKQAVYQTDAVVKKEEKTETPAEEVPVAEAKAEEKTEE